MLVDGCYQLTTNITFVYIFTLSNIQLNSNKVLITTEDGSHTLYMPDLNENYHSTFGAIQESNHVFIDKGFNGIIKSKKSIQIFEMGFGTGLNALLTLIEAEKQNVFVQYFAIEAYPLEDNILKQLNYGNIIEEGKYEELFNKINNASWEKSDKLSPHFEIKKLNTSILEFVTANKFDLVYFDAFAPEVQPELWTEDIFRKLFSIMNPGGILVTYCCKGIVKRNMKTAGFNIEKLPGPPGKREMLRAQR